MGLCGLKVSYREGLSWFWAQVGFVVGLFEVKYKWIEDSV